MDIAIYFEHSPPPRDLKDRVLAIFMISLVIRCTDIVFAIIHSLSLHDFTALHEKKVNNDPDLAAFIFSFQLTSIILCIKNIFAGNTIDVLFLKHRHRLLHIILNAILSGMIAVLGDHDHRSQTEKFPDDLQDSSDKLLIYYTIFHGALPIATIAWIIMMSTPGFNCRSGLEVDIPDEPTVESRLTIPQQPRVEPLPPTTTCNAEETNCPICLDPVFLGIEIFDLSCKHVYHKECLEKWLTTDINHKCPLCANPV
jgi:hypothetical protein